MIVSRARRIALGARGDMSKTLILTAAIVAAALFYLALYAASGVHAEYLRAESGLLMEWGMAGRDSDFANHFLVRAYNSHFTPVMFWLEYQQARLIGFNETYWSVRNALAAGVLTVSIAGFIASLWRAPDRLTWALAGAIALAVVVQPAMTELLIWPFMLMQALTMSALFWTATLLMRLARADELNSARLAAPLATAYLSLHFTGAGLPISVATIGCVALVVMLHGGRTSRLAWVVIGAAALATMLHGYLMLQGEPERPGEAVSLVANMLRFGTLTAEMLRQACLSLTVSQFPMPDPRVFIVQSVFGLGLWIIIAAGCGVMLARYLATKDRELLARLVGVGLGAGAAGLLIASSLVRLRTAPDAGMISYIIGTRYFLYVTVFALIALAAALAPRTSTASRTQAAAGLAIALVAVTGSLVFWRTYGAELWPRSVASTTDVWNAAVASARADIAAGRPITPVPLGLITETPVGTDTYPALLKAALGLPQSSELVFAPPE